MPKFLKTPLKTHGGKNYLAKWIIDNFPEGYESLSYGEIFVGGGSVLLRKKKSPTEWAFDKDRAILCVWNALKECPTAFISRLEGLTYSAQTFEKAVLFFEGGGLLDSFDVAVNEYVVRRMSRGGMRKTFAWSERLRGGKPGDLNAWETARDKLPLVAARVKDVFFRNWDFRASMETLNRPDFLLYLDPPYLKSTRARGATKVYVNEMDDQDHRDMLDLCNASKAKIVLSGYDSGLYDDSLSSWNRSYKTVPNHAGQNKHKSTRREVLWKNF